MINPPEIYAEWVKVLDALRDKENDEEVLQAIKQGTIVWQTAVAERFSYRLMSVIQSRLKQAAEKIQVDFNRAAGEERLIVQALLSMRKELSFLSEIVDIPDIPEQVTNKYQQLIKKQAELTQESLEDSAQTDKTGKLSSIVRNHKVNVF